MSLSERLQNAQSERHGRQDLSLAIARGDATTERAENDPFFVLKKRAQDALFARLGTRMHDASMSEEQLGTFVVQELGRVIEAEQVPLTAEERARLVAELTDDVLGYGAIERYLADPSITEVMVNSTDGIYVERDGRLEHTASRYLSQEQLRQVIDRIVSAVGRRIDESSPMVDARLADGSRVNAVIPPLAVDGPVLTIRKFSPHVYGHEQLVEKGTMTPEIVNLLWAAVQGRLNVLVTGGTGTGKTTMLNVLSSFIPEDQRIVTIEDAVELRLRQHHVIRLESRPPNIEGKGQVAIRDLVRNALRMRPDRIIVGEVRGGEALDMLQPMNTGHRGSLTTAHANGPYEAMLRLETMSLMAGVDLPLLAIREQIKRGIDVVVHQERTRAGDRRITSVSEMAATKSDAYVLREVSV